MPQHTLAAPFEVEGVGLHGGRPVRLRVEGAPADAGLRVAVAAGRPRAARVDAVTETAYGTCLGAGPGRVRTVEHWLAALVGSGIDNATLTLLEGDELPAMDGSAAPAVAEIRAVGRTAQRAPRRCYVVQRPVTVYGRGGAFARLEPTGDARPMLVGRYAFARPIGRTAFSLALTPDTFAEALAPARTFARIEDVRALRASGLAAGGRLDNALVFGPEGPLNPEGLRFSDECARHKLLDAVGDLALLGRPWRGRYVGHRSGHALNVALVHRALRTPGVLSETTISP